MAVAQTFQDEVPATDRRTLEVEARSDWVSDQLSAGIRCFGSTLVEIRPGVLLCCWSAGKGEAGPDLGIWHARFEGGTWSSPALFVSYTERPHWNPVLFRDERFGVFLFFRVGDNVRSWRTYWMRSEDGRSWSEPVPLVPNDHAGRGPSKNAPIVLSSGSWLAPASTELGGWGCFADRSDDGGASWRHTNYFRVDHTVVRGKGPTRPAFWESRPGRVHAVMQTTSGWVGRSDSIDGGRSWSSVQLMELPNPNTPIDALPIPTGRVIMALNPAHDAYATHVPLCLAVSENNGASWYNGAVLESEPGRTYTYPALTRLSDGLAVSYTVDGTRIRCWQIPAGLL